MNSSIRFFLAVVCCLELVAGPAFAIRHETSDEDWARFCVYRPEPVIPMVALRKGWGGLISCVLKINPKTGVVDEVSVVRHTHFPQLDAIMVLTLFKWRFRPGISRTTINYELGVLGRSRDYHSGMY